MRIIIAGDLVPTQSNIDLFNKADLDILLYKDLLSLWDSVDMRIFNLEVPLTDKKSPIAKCGPNLIAPTSTIDGIKALNPSLLTLANNHILDQGEQGFKSTLDILKKNNIPFTGAGENLAEANKPFFIDMDGKKIGVYACAENEFSIATKVKPGANPFDPLDTLDHIQLLKKECDYVIVLYHGGKEHYRYPSPYLQKISRKMVDKGADLIVCQHSHCIGCSEVYSNSTIVYGQGNFIFNRYDNEFWNNSLLINLTFGDKINIDYTPIVTKNNAIRLANDNESKEILEAFNMRSSKILQEGFIEQEYEKFASQSIDNYLREISGFGIWLSRIDRHLFKGRLLDAKYNEKKLLAIQNYIECEAHRELFIAGIKNILAK